MRSTSGHLRAAFALLAIALVALLGALGPAALPAQGATPSSVSAYVVLPDPDDDDDRDRRDRDDDDNGRDRDWDRDRGDRGSDRRDDDDDDDGRDRDWDRDRGDRESDRRDDDDDRDGDRRDRDGDRRDRDDDRDGDRRDRDGDRPDRDDDDDEENGTTPARRPATITGPPPPPPAPAPAPRAASALSAIVRIRGRVTTRGARLTLLGVRAPRGALVVGRCLGGRCPVRRQAARARSPVALRRFHRYFRAGTVIVVRVTMPGRIGKFTRFTIRRRKPPLRRDLCLAPGVRRPVSCP